MFALKSKEHGYLVGWWRTSNGLQPAFDRSKGQAEVYRTRKQAAQGLDEAQPRVNFALEVVKVGEGVVKTFARNVK